MDTVPLFIELVKIASPSGKEQTMAAYLKTWLSTHKFKYQIDSVGNIYAKNSGKGKPLLLCAHMDTVQPGENIHPIINDGVIKSDGKTILGADNKASLAAMLTAIGNDVPRSLELLFTVKEETGGGVEYFPFHWIQSKKALLFDSANPLGGIVLRSPNISNFDITFLGKSAHASTPDSGINAIIPAIEAISDIPLGSLDGGETTINIGLINGGTGINTVPGYIHFQGEVRSYRMTSLKKYMTSIKNVVRKNADKYRAKGTFKTFGHCKGYSHDKSAGCVKSLARIIESIGLNVVHYDYSGISDANILNSAGIQTYNMTDGVKNPHTTNEQINISDLKKLCMLINKCTMEL